MRFVQDDRGISPAGFARKPVAGLIEDRPLDGTHQHVFEHRVVGDEQIGRRLLDLVPGDEFHVVGERDGAPEFSGLPVLPVAALGAKPGNEAGLCRPFAARLELAEQFACLVMLLGGGIGRLALDLHIEIVEGAQLARIFVACADARIRRAAGVARKTRRSLRPLLEEAHRAGIAEERTQAAQLVVHQCVHRIEDQRAHGRLLAKGRRIALGFARKLAENRQQERFGLTRARARHDE